jgi:ubiquinone/menaquinone biosynthesis C-methylase UbiE
VAERYDAGAHEFDAVLAQHPSSARRFYVVDAPQRRLAAEAGRVLDLGCGTGRLLASCRTADGVGVDVAFGLLRLAVARGLTVVNADGHRLPFPDACFDVIVSGNAVFRYLDYELAFAECARVLRPGGRLGVHQYFGRPRWWSRTAVSSSCDIHDLHVRRLDELQRPAAAAGLVAGKCHAWRSISCWPYLVRVPAWLGPILGNHLTWVFTRPVSY